MSRSVNMVIIVGNLTRDPEMRYTPQGHAVTSFGVATNRRWVSDGQERESVEYHNVVAWNKLAEICSQLLSKGRKVYVQGRLQTRTWDDQQGVRHWKTEIVADDMVVLDKRPGAFGGEEYVAADVVPSEPAARPEKPEEEAPAAVGNEEEKSAKSRSAVGGKEGKAELKNAAKKVSQEKEESEENVEPGDMPF